jgi:hypothetical protein
MSKGGFGKRCATSAGRQPGGLSQTRSLSPQLRVCQAVLRQRPVDLGVGPQRVPAVERAARAIDAGLGQVFVAEGAEQPVPDDQDAAVVLVEVVVVHRVVHPVVRGAAEPAVEPAQLGHVLGVHPVLVEQVDQRDDAEHQRRHAGHGHRQVEDPAEQRAAAGLAQRGGQVVVLALVVHHVRGPEHGHLVAHAVQPVVAEVVEDQRQQPALPGGPEGTGLLQRHQRDRRIDRGVQAHPQQPGEHRADLAQHAQADAVDGIGQPVGVAPLAHAPREFEGDQQEKNRRGKDDDLAGAHPAILGPIRSARPSRQP